MYAVRLHIIMYRASPRLDSMNPSWAVEYVPEATQRRSLRRLRSLICEYPWCRLLGWQLAKVPPCGWRWNLRFGRHIQLATEGFPEKWCFPASRRSESSLPVPKSWNRPICVDHSLEILFIAWPRRHLSWNIWICREVHRTDIRI